MEFFYDDPLSIRKISQFFKSMVCTNIQIIFREREIIMYSVDHTQKSRIRVRINTTNVNRYYLLQEFEVGVLAENLEEVLNCVDKEYLVMMMTSNLVDYRNRIFAMYSTAIGIEELHSIELVSAYDAMGDETQFTNEEGYMVQFRLPSKYFRKTINDMKSLSKTVSVCQDAPDAPVQFIYAKEINRKIRSRHTITKTSDVGLVSKLKAGNTFRVTFDLGYVKPISHAQLGNHVTLMLDENRPLMIKAMLSPDIEVKVLTCIIKRTDA
jgi:hypothetical protein